MIIQVEGTIVTQNVLSHLIYFNRNDNLLHEIEAKDSQIKEQAER